MNDLDRKIDFPEDCLHVCSAASNSETGEAFSIESLLLQLESAEEFGWEFDFTYKRLTVDYTSEACNYTTNISNKEKDVSRVELPGIFE